MTDQPITDRLDQQTDERVDERVQQLAAEAEGLGRRRAGAGQGDRWLAVAGGVGLALGVVLILLGWYGTAQTTLEFEQVPYLVSGGLLGLALVVAGGLLYVCAWLTRLVRDNQQQQARTAAHQERVEQSLSLIAERLAAAPAADGTPVVTSGGTMLHRPTCAATVGQVVRPAGPEDTGLALCGLCRPEALPVAVPAARPRATRRPRERKTA